VSSCAFRLLLDFSSHSTAALQAMQMIQNKKKATE
jgi:hypothetical protein